MAKVEKFWIVLKPVLTSELADILGEFNVAGLARQFLGGPKPERELVGVYYDEQEARKEAADQLENRSRALGEADFTTAVVADIPTPLFGRIKRVQNGVGEIVIDGKPPEVTSPASWIRDLLDKLPAKKTR